MIFRYKFVLNWLKSIEIFQGSNKISLNKYQVYRIKQKYKQQMQGQQKQINKFSQRTKHYHSHLPKGSYHSYCRRRIFQMNHEATTNMGKSRKNIKSFLTHREKPNRLTAIDHAQNFQQYLMQFERPFTTAVNAKSRNLTTNNQPRTTKAVGSKENKKIENQQIIQSHLPFFKCKLQKTESLAKKPDFRVKENKFKVVKNVIESNLINYMGHSVQLINY